MTARDMLDDLIERLKAQIAREEAFEAKHRAEGDGTKARAARSTATVLRRLLRETGSPA